MADFFIRDNCRLCNSKNIESVVKLEDTPPANAFVNKDELNKIQEKFPLELFFCNDCNHLQLCTVVNPNKLFENYVYVSGTSPVFIKHFDEYCDSIINSYKPDKNKLVVDIGSNDGTFLNFFKKKGFKVLGVDPAKNITKLANKKGIDTIPSFFNNELAEEILIKYGEASLITANNVFAHSDNLSEIINAVKKLISQDGLFIFEVSYLGDVFEKSLFDTIYHEHLAYHSVIPLIKFFRKNKMELINVEKISTHGGSIRGVVQKLGGSREPDTSIDIFVNYEKKLGFNNKKTFQEFSNKIQNIKKELNEILISLKKEGKIIAGFGAPAKATTLMYQFGIDKNIIDFIVDDNPLKQNKYTPGLHIPVFSSKYIKEKKPDYILILAWNFADSIIKKNSDFSDHNGRFIIPLPTIKIV